MAWKESPKDSSAVIDDTYEQMARVGDVIHYGGRLVAESIPPDCKPVIVAAPELLAMLKSVEWASFTSRNGHILAACPLCYMARRYGHRSDCKLARLIERAEGSVA